MGTVFFVRLKVQGAYEKKKEAVTEEMEVEAGKMEKDLEEDFGVVSKLPFTRGQLKWNQNQIQQDVTRFKRYNVRWAGLPSIRSACGT